ncbi:MFS transporter [Candidatus Woesearchaeota archaeon]|nr:MFS transporter [Candidatus Woesearchaeota archaeon]
MRKKEEKEIEQRKLQSNIKKFYLWVFVGSFFFINSIFLLYYRHFELSFSDIALIQIVVLIAVLLLEVPSGAFADLVGRKWSIVLGDCLMLAGVLIFAVGSTLPVFLIAAVVYGSGGAFISGSRQAIIYDTFKKLKRQKDFLKFRSREAAIFSGVGIFTSYFSPYLFSLNVRYPYYAGAIFMVFSILTGISFFEPPFKRKKLSIMNHYIQMKESLISILRHSRLLWLLLFSIVSIFAIAVFHHLTYQPYITNNLGFTVKQMGIILAIVAVVQLVSSLLAPKIEKILTEKWSLLTIILVQVACFGLLGYFVQKYIVFVFVLIFPIWIFQELIIENYMHWHIKSHQRATIFSISSLFYSLILIILLPIFGLVIDAKGIPYLYLLLAGLVLVTGLIMFFLRYNKRVWKSLD